MDPPVLLRKSLVGMVQLVAALALFFFVPAGTVRYWQAWILLLTFSASSLAITLFLFRHDRALLERRLKAGPFAERQTAQKIISALAAVVFVAALVVPALDHRFAWSHVPPWAALCGDGLVVLVFFFIFRVVRENAFASSTIEIGPGQRVISTGPYAIVRHPMYAGALLLFIAIPLALGSWWGMLAFFPALLAMAARLRNEEKFLLEHLAGYEEYRRETRYRLVPGVW